MDIRRARKIANVFWCIATIATPNDEEEFERSCREIFLLWDCAHCEGFCIYSWMKIQDYDKRDISHFQ